MRQSGYPPHKLIDALLIGLTTVAAGWGEYSVMEDFGRVKPDFFLQCVSGIAERDTR
ncbi:MAG: hypothetical protein LBG57_11440 [Treponema sp.]|nr:hypothetical protein [Treponema sp.]